MRLLKIGRDASCDIVLHSDKVSALHAEITVLNSGDILLEDKNSRNGTYLMNNPVKAGTPVSVRRGDAIRFADAELQWSRIPMENNSNYKGLFGIGSNFRNEIQITGNTVSRFHATLKLGKDGKIYIQDHSKNGTTVNGTRIVFGHDIRIKRSDVVVCGGVQIDVKRFIPNRNLWLKALGVATAAAAIIAGCIFLIKLVPAPTPTPPSNALQNATACVYGQYYIEVTIKDDPFIKKFEDWPRKWIFGIPEEADRYVLELGTLTGVKIKPIPYSGTAFFISENGELGTNRHIALPWEYISETDEEFIRRTMNFIINNENSLPSIIVTQLKAGKLTLDDVSNYRRMAVSAIEISGRMEFLGVALTGNNIGAPSDIQTCQLIAESNDKNKDVALLRLNNKETPKHIVNGGFFDIKKARTDESTYTPQEPLTIIGYPGGFQLGFFTNDGKELAPTVHTASISKKADENNFQFQGQSIGGQSGSPILDGQRRLIGVLHSGFSHTEFSFGCNIKHLVELYDKHKVK
jgi:pSer/pThr/pTyr-binding forkhead associated (FHA) protein